MFRSAIIAICFVIILGACSAVETPVPIPTATATFTATNTASFEDMTAAATYRPTLVASFTPTFTPTITLTPTHTHTPIPTATATAIPEDLLCEQLSITDITSSETLTAEELEDYKQVYIPYKDISIAIDVINYETGESIQNGTLGGDYPWILRFTPANFPEVGEYEWIITLEDETRTGMCEQRGRFDTREDELPQPESTAEATPELTAEATNEATAEVEVTGEATEVLSEATSEATEAVLIEATANATTIPFRFPPR